MEVDVVSLSSEFPNDNPALHRGARWMCLTVTGPAVAIAAPIEAAPVVVPPVPLPLPLRAIMPAPAPAPIVLALVPTPAQGPASVSVAELLATPFEIERAAPPPALALAPALAPAPALALAPAPAPALVPAPPPIPEARISGIVPAGMVHGADDDDVEDDDHDEILVEDLPPLDESATVEGAVALAEPTVAAAAPAPAPAVARGPGIASAPAPAAPSTALPPAPDDPFVIFVTALVDVAIGAGSPHVASVLPALLLEGRLVHALPAEAAEALAEAGVARGTEVTAVFQAQTRAWRQILAGTSDDFSACGNAMLDEWAADLLARLLGAPARAAGLRRDLRSRGVAAFGLVEAA